MSDQFVEAAKDQRNVIERLIKGLPGIRGYVDKETRRNADYRLRQMIADELERSRSALYEIQNKLLSSGGLSWLDDIDVVVSKVSTLADRIKTASYGYAGFFDTVRIKEDALDALHRFDVALMNEVAKIESAIAGLRSGLDDTASVGALVEQAKSAVVELTSMFDRRERAILAPDLLTANTFVPDEEMPAPSRSADVSLEPTQDAPAGDADPSI